MKNFLYAFEVIFILNEKKCLKVNLKRKMICMISSNTIVSKSLLFIQILNYSKTDILFTNFNQINLM